LLRFSPVPHTRLRLPAPLVCLYIWRLDPYATLRFTRFLVLCCCTVYTRTLHVVHICYAGYTRTRTVRTLCVCYAHTFHTFCAFYATVTRLLHLPRLRFVRAVTTVYGSRTTHATVTVHCLTVPDTPHLLYSRFAVGLRLYSSRFLHTRFCGCVYTTVWFTHFVHYVTVRYVVYLQPSHTRAGLFALRFIHTQHLHGLRAHTYAPLLLRLFTVAYTDCGLRFTLPLAHFYGWLPVCWAFAHTAVTVCFTFTLVRLRLVPVRTHVYGLRCTVGWLRLYAVDTFTLPFTFAAFAFGCARAGCPHTHAPVCTRIHTFTGCHSWFWTHTRPTHGLRLYVRYTVTFTHGLFGYLTPVSYVAFGCPGCGYCARQHPHYTTVGLHGYRYLWLVARCLRLRVLVYGYIHGYALPGYARACGCTRVVRLRGCTRLHTRSCGLRFGCWFGFGLPRCLHTALGYARILPHGSAPFTVVTHVTFTPHAAVHPHWLVTLRCVDYGRLRVTGSLHIRLHGCPHARLRLVGFLHVAAGSITLVCTHIQFALRTRYVYRWCRFTVTHTVYTHGSTVYTALHTVTGCWLHVYTCTHTFAHVYTPRLPHALVVTFYTRLRLRTYTGYVCWVTFRLGWFPRTRFTHARYTFAVGCYVVHYIHTLLRSRWFTFATVYGWVHTILHIAVYVTAFT